VLYDIFTHAFTRGKNKLETRHKPCKSLQLFDKKGKGRKRQVEVPRYRDVPRYGNRVRKSARAAEML